MESPDNGSRVDEHGEHAERTWMPIRGRAGRSEGRLADWVAPGHRALAGLHAHAAGAGTRSTDCWPRCGLYTGRERPVHDDVTNMVAGFVEGPRRPAIRHVLKNRLRPGRVEVAAIRRRQDAAAGPVTPSNAGRGEQAPAAASLGGTMKAARIALAAVLALGALAHAQQAPSLVSEVRAAIARQDFAEGERLIAVAARLDRRDADRHGSDVRGSGEARWQPDSSTGRKATPSRPTIWRKPR